MDQIIKPKNRKMMNIYHFAHHKLVSRAKLLCYFLPFLFFLPPKNGWSQQNLLIPEVRTLWANPTFSGFVIDTSSVGYSKLTGIDRDTTRWQNSPYNLVDNAPSTIAKVRLISEGGSSGIDAAGKITISNNQIYSKNNIIQLEYSISDVGLTLFKSNLTVTLETSLDGINFVAVGNQISTETSNDNYQIGAIATSNFNYLRINFNLPKGSIGIYRKGTISLKNIYFFDKANYLSQCNTSQKLSYSNSLLPYKYYTVTGSATGKDNLFDIDTNNYASVTLAGNSIRVKSEIDTFPAHSLIGFELSQFSLLNLSLAEGYTIRTYLNGIVQDTLKTTAFGLGVGLIAASEKYKVQIATTKPANEYEFIWTTGLNLGGLNIYNTYIKPLCENEELASPSTVLTCNTTVKLNDEDFPVYASTESSAAIGISVGSGIGNIHALLNKADTTPVKIISAVGVNVAGSMEVIVKKAKAAFTGTNYVGFNVSTPGLLNLNVLSNVSIDI